MATATNTVSKARAPRRERRSNDRPTMVLRVGALVAGRRTSFCLVKNISAEGVAVKLYSRVNLRARVRLTVGDEDEIEGQVAWVRGQLAGIRFDQPLDPQRLLRATQKAAASKRRSSPRVNVAARALLKTRGQTLAGELFNISTSGAKLRTSRPLGEGHPVSLILPDLPAILAFVRWSEEKILGLVFQTPVPVPVLAPWLAERLRVSPGSTPPSRPPAAKEDEMHPNRRSLEAFLKPSPLTPG